MRRMILRGRCRRRILVAVAALALLATPGLAQDSAATIPASRPDTTDQSYRYRLLGVYGAQSGQPVQGAEVSDALSGASARTSATGTVSLFFLPDGGSLVRIRKFGYAMQTMVVAISPADTVPVTVALEPAVQLPEVVTTGRAGAISPLLRGFEERRLHGATGHFIPDSVLRKEESRTLGNVLLSHIPGINIVERGRATLLEPSPRCTNGGPPDVYLDGVKLAHVTSDPWKQRHGAQIEDPKQRGSFTPPTERASSTSPGTTPMDLSAFKVLTLAGVEYYPDGASVPAEFNTTSKGCGALLLWTREK